LRKLLPVNVRLGKQTQPYPAEIVNISAGGVFIKTNLKVQPNDLLTLDLKVAGEAEPIYVYGTVVRDDGQGYGVAFLRTSQATSDVISYLLRKWQRLDSQNGAN